MRRVDRGNCFGRQGCGRRSAVSGKVGLIGIVLPIQRRNLLVPLLQFFSQGDICRTRVSAADETKRQQTENRPRESTDHYIFSSAGGS